MMTQLQSNAAQVGIKLNVEPKPASEVGAGGNCVVGHIPCNWDMAYYGNGWTFSPDFLPTGDTLFLCNGVADIGGYCNQTNDAMIEKTLTSSNLQYMYTWQNYLASQLPEIWAPDAAAQLTEIARQPEGCPAAERDAQHQPGELVLREVAPAGGLGAPGHAAVSLRSFSSVAAWWLAAASGGPASAPGR